MPSAGQAFGVDRSGGSLSSLGNSHTPLDGYQRDKDY